ncbi:hypothetical protein Tco_1350718, partial [Tanacetum coccineum]
DIKSVLTQKALKIFYETVHITKEVHPELPSPNQIIHEMPTGKIGVYTRFFEYANFRLPLSTFLVDVLKHYRIHISQLSVIAAAKVSHFEILCRVHGFEPTVDTFACPASFQWHTSKSVLKDPFPKSSEFNAEHYATLVAYPAPFHKYPEPFICLVGMSRNYTLDENTYPEFLCDNDEEMDLLSFIRITDPTKVRIGERQRAEDEPKLLDTTVGRVVPLLPIAPARAESELEASVDKLFDEGGSGNQVEQGDSASDGGGQGINIRPVTEITDTVVKIVIPLQLRRLKKRKNIVADAGGPSHPPKKLREDHETPSGASMGGKSRPIPTLPFVTSSVSTTPEREGRDYTDSVVGTNLQTVGPPQSLSVSLMLVATTVTSTVDPTTTVKEKFVESSVFGSDSSSAGGVDHTVGGFSDLTGSDLIVSGIRTVVISDIDLQKVYVPQWSVTNGSHLDDGRVYQEMVDEFAPPKFFVSIYGMEHDQLFMEFNVGLLAKCLSVLKNLKAQLLLKKAEAAEAIHLRAEASKFETVEKSLQDEVKNLKEHNVILEKEKSELGVKVADLAASVKVREQEVADLDVVVNSVHELEASSAILREKVTMYENYTEQLEKFQDKQIKVMNDKFDKL